MYLACCNAKTANADAASCAPASCCMPENYVSLSDTANWAVSVFVMLGLLAVSIITVRISILVAVLGILLLGSETRKAMAKQMTVG